MIKQAAFLLLVVGVLVVVQMGFQSPLEPRVGILETRVGYIEQFVPTASATQTVTPTATSTATFTATPTATPTATSTGEFDFDTPTQEVMTPEGRLGVRVSAVVLNIRSACSINATRVGQFRQNEIVLVLIDRSVTADGYVWLPLADLSGRCVAWKRLDSRGNVIETYLAE